MKNVKKVIALAMITVMTLAFTACGGGGSKVEKFANSEAAKTMASQFSGNGLDVGISSVDGNVLVFTFTFEEQQGEDVVAAMTQNIDGLADSLGSTVDQLADEIGQDDLVVRFVYVNADGSEIASKDFE